jgi:hypothetical protein
VKEQKKKHTRQNGCGKKCKRGERERERRERARITGPPKSFRGP